MNYTPEQTEMMVARYEANKSRECVEELAEELGKSIKSIIGKLSREGVYRKQIYLTKQGSPPITKSEMVANIAVHLGFDSDELVGLDKTPKLVLQKLEKALCS